jgi:hypothetical protein
MQNVETTLGTNTVRTSSLYIHIVQIDIVRDEKNQTALNDDVPGPFHRAECGDRSSQTAGLWR